MEFLAIKATGNIQTVIKELAEVADSMKKLNITTVLGALQYNYQKNVGGRRNKVVYYNEYVRKNLHK